MRTHEINLMPLDFLEEAAECLRVLAHPVRLRIVEILLQGRFTVGEVARMCGLPSHQVSEHLRMLKMHGLLDCRRQGRAAYYSIADERAPKLLGCIRASCQD